MKKVFALALASAVIFSAAAAIAKPIVVIPERAGRTESFAAYELAYWLGEITGEHISVVGDAALAAGESPRLNVGRSATKNKFDELIKTKLRTNDGFAVQRDGDDIYIFGASGRATLFGVYGFLERNTDIIWPRMEPGLEAVFSKVKEFTPTQTDFVDIPLTRYRGLQWTFHSADRPGRLWDARNRANRCNDPLLGGDYTNAGVGHGIRFFVNPDEYFDDHPEWYPFVDGKRQKRGQLCFTATNMIPTYVENMRRHLKEMYPKSAPRNMQVDYVNVSITDGWGLCTCEECTKPFTYAGVTIYPTNSVFRSAQYYAFVNEVAKELKKTHPRASLGVYAYIFTSEPPPFALEKNIRVQICPIVRNEKAPLTDDARNGKWREWYTQWARTVPYIWIRDYFGDSPPFPRPIEDTVWRDFNEYYLGKRILEFSAEWPLDIPNESETNFELRFKDYWDANAMSAWLIMRLWWNPKVDINELRDYYLERVYREAAPAMREYYRLIREAYFASPVPENYFNTLLPLVKEYIVKPGIIDACSKALADAAAAAQHPVSKEIIARQQRLFETWIEKAGKDDTVRLNVARNEEEELFDFGAKAWENAPSTGSFIVADHARKGQTPIFDSRAKLLHNVHNLYILFDCGANDMATLAGNVSPRDGTERFPRGDIMEFFLGNPETGDYFHFALDVGNEGKSELDVVYDAHVNDATWNCNWTRKIVRENDRWRVIVKMPLAELGFDNLTLKNKLLFLPIRGKYYDTEEGKRTREMTSWGGGWVHQVAGFGEITLDMQ